MASKAFTYILKFAGDSKDLDKKVKGITGVVKTAAVAAGALFAADKVLDAAKAVAEYAKEISAVSVEVQKLTGLTGAALDQVTGSAQAVANVFDKDVNETLKTANALSKQFGEEFDNSLDLIAQGLATNADLNDDFLQQVSEYSALFKEAGLGASEMVALMAEASSQGIFDDKGADVIKEATLRIREMTTSTTDALKGIGIDSDKLQRDLAEGNIRIFDVIQMVSSRLGELPDQSAKVGTAIADIFGGPGEDAGLQYLRTLQDINLDLDKVVANSGDAAAAQLRMTEAQKEFHTVGAQVFGNTGTLILKIKTTLLEFVNAGIKGIVNLVNYFIDLYNQSLLFRAAIQGIKLVIKTVFEGARLIVKNFLNILKTAGRLVKAVFTFDFKSIKAILKRGLNDVVDDYKEAGQRTAKAFVKAGEAILTPKKKVELIGLSTEQADLAGQATGRAFAEGVVTGADVGALGLFRPKKIGKVESKEAKAVSVITDAGLPGQLQQSSVLIDEQTLKMSLLIEKQTEYADAVASSVDVVANSFAMIGDAIGGVGGTWLQVVGSILGKIPQLITQITALSNAQLAGSIAVTTGKQAEASGSAAASAAALPFPANIAAIIAAVGLVVGIFASFPKPKKLAKGGIAGGPISAVVGEYPGAIENPEIISPLSDLRKILFAGMSQFFGGATQVNFGQAELRLDTIRLGVEQSQRKQGRVF